MAGRACRFVCDAMLGKLARWLRAAGYDAAWTYGIDDEDLVRQAQAEARVLVTSDGPLMAHRLIRDGTVRAVFVPRNLDAAGQLRHVLTRLDLGVAAPRCMACGGELVPVTKATVADDVPARALAAFDDFRRCDRCGKVYWQGTHWRKIERVLKSVAAKAV